LEMQFSFQGENCGNISTRSKNMSEAEATKTGGKEAAEAHGLEYIYQTMNLSIPSGSVDLAQYKNTEVLATSHANERISAALAVFIDSVAASNQSVEKIDKAMLDYHIGEIDRKLSLQLDEIIHHPTFQKMETSWRSLKFLVDRIDFKKNVKLDILDTSKEELATDFEDAPETIQSGLYKHVYTSEYDTPGGEPYATVVSNYDFDSGPSDITLLQNVSKVSAACHCPFLGSASPKFFGKQTMQDLTKIEDLHNYMERSEFLKWNSFRQTEDSRYVGLMLPRVMLRLPYGPDTQPVKDFNYIENVKGDDHDKYRQRLVRANSRSGGRRKSRGPSRSHLRCGKGKPNEDPDRNPDSRNQGIRICAGRLYSAFVLQESQLCVFLFGQFDAEAGGIRRSECYGQHAHQFAAALYFPGVAHRALFESNSAGKHRLHEKQGGAAKRT
jgi:hypothetical protein